MKLYGLSSILIFIIVAKECMKAKVENSLPACIQQKIDAIKKEPRWNPPAEVHQYTYNGQTVYYFSSDCCDQFNTVYDAQCNYICAPSGGITGKGDGKCAGFNTEAKHVRLVWKDER